MYKELPSIDRALVGDNPFIGVDHLSRARARDRATGLDPDRIIEVLDSAFATGAQGLSFSTHPMMYRVLRRMKETSYSRPFGAYPLVPYAQEYVRLANEKGSIGLAAEVLSKLSWKGKARTLAGAGLSLFSIDPIRILNLYVDAELEMVMNSLPARATLKSILLHEIITDLACSLDAAPLIQAYIDHVLKRYEVRPGFVTRNFAKFLAFTKRNQIDLDKILIVTPFNKVGFQMNPSREACERALEQADERIHIVAMSILAAGYLGLNDALEYLSRFSKIRSYVVGVSTRAHAEQTFSQMKRSIEVAI